MSLPFSHKIYSFTDSRTQHCRDNIFLQSENISSTRFYSPSGGQKPNPGYRMTTICPTATKPAPSFAHIRTLPATGCNARQGANRHKNNFEQFCFPSPEAHQHSIWLAVGQSGIATDGFCQVGCFVFHPFCHPCSNSHS